MQQQQQCSPGIFIACRLKGDQQNRLFIKLWLAIEKAGDVACFRNSPDHPIGICDILILDSTGQMTKHFDRPT